MYEAQRFVDSQENANFGDPKSWLSGEDHNSSPTHRLTQSSLVNSTATAPAGPNGSLDRVLFQDLVEIVPLVQSLIVNSLSLSLGVFFFFFFLVFVFGSFGFIESRGFAYWDFE
jgi:hypothetical protein